MCSTKRAISRPAESQKLLPLDGSEDRAHHLRGRLERQAILEQPPLPRDPVEELFRAGGEPADQHQRIAVPHGQARASPLHLRGLGRGGSTRPDRVRESGGRQRSAGLRRQQLRHDAATAASSPLPRPSVKTWFSSTPTTDTAIVTKNFPDECEAVYEALVLGTRDYIRKCGFSRVLIGLSGGIDSSLTAVIAVDAVGARTLPASACPGRILPDHSVTRRARHGGRTSASASK